MEAQCNFCASCLTEDSGGSWWTTGQGKSVWCQMCWERESAKGWWAMIGELNELSLLAE